MADETVIPFPGTTLVRVPPEEMLEQAKNWGMVKCLVIGIDDKDELCFGGSFSDTALINMLLDLAKGHTLDAYFKNGVRKA